jgi:hypothetical protein
LKQKTGDAEWMFRGAGILRCVLPQTHRGPESTKKFSDSKKKTGERG